MAGPCLRYHLVCQDHPKFALISSSRIFTCHVVGLVTEVCWSTVGDDEQRDRKSMIPRRDGSLNQNVNNNGLLWPRTGHNNQQRDLNLLFPDKTRSLSGSLLRCLSCYRTVQIRKIGVYLLQCYMLLWWRWRSGEMVGSVPKWDGKSEWNVHIVVLYMYLNVPVFGYWAKLPTAFPHYIILPSNWISRNRCIYRCNYVMD